MAVKPIPDGFHTITPHLVVRDGAKAIDFYKKAFGAEEVMRMPGPGGQGIMHAELKIGDSLFMLAGEMPGCEGGPKAPQSLNGSSFTMHLYVKDCDAALKKATAAGAEVTMPCTDMFWGDRYGCTKDPFGHHWAFATHKEDVTPEQCMKRAEAFFASMGGH